MISQSVSDGRRNAWLLGVVLVVVGALFWAASWEADRQEQGLLETFRREVVDKAQISEAIIAGRLRAYDDTLLALREIYVADLAQFDQRVRWLRRGPLADPELLVVVVDREGYLAYTDAPNVAPRLDLRQRLYFRHFAEGGKDRFHVDEPVFGRVTQRHSLPLARPIYDRQGAFHGVVALSVTQDSLADFDPNLQLSGDTTISVVTERGAVVTRSRDLAQAQGTTIPPERLAKLEGRKGVFSDWSDGDEHILAFRHLEGLPLIVYASASPRDVMGLVAKQRALLMSGAGVLSFFVLLLALGYLQRQKTTAKFIATQQAYLTQAQRMAGMGSWELDLATNRFQWSDEMYRRFGVSPEGVHPDIEYFLARVVERDRTAVRAAVEKAVVDGTSGIEFSLRRGDGQQREMLMHAEAVRNPAGKAAFLIGTLRDVTETRKAEQALREREARYRAVVETSADGFWVLDSSTGRILEVNDRYSHRSGYTREELHELSVFDIDAKNSREELVALISKPADPTLAIFETLHRAKDGSIWPVEVSTVHMPIEGGQRYSFLRDISERKRAEEALARQSRRSEVFLHNASDGVHILDADGNVLEVSDSFCQMLGYSREDLIGANVSLWAGQWSPQELKQIIAGQIAKNGRSVFETQHRRRDGSFLDVELTGRGLELDGKPALFNSSRDITERKRAEAERAQLELQLRESQKMQALGTLAGGVAHDFNNALATIMGNVELARQDVGPGHPALESLEEIGKAGRRAKALVQQILAFGRRQVMERKVISLAPVVQESARLLRATLPAGVSLKVECAPEAPPVLGDATQIEQVLLNLCSNAWHAIQARTQAGLIEVLLHEHLQTAQAAGEGSRAALRGELRPGRHARVTVRDNGPGMDQEILERIFEPFFTTKPTGQGTGLGLAVVHGIVQAHEASIEVRSAPGQGTSFVIYFPAAQVAAATERDRHAIGGDQGETLQLPAEGKHVLYIDDDESIVLLTTRLLERQGFRVSGYTDARAALAAARAHPDRFDLAVTDYNMPGMSGLEVARALREIRADLPVALASGYITEELRAEAPAAGVRELIYKPNSVEDLCQTVARLALAHGTVHD